VAARRGAGDAGALFNLGLCHRDGRGVPLDVDEALRLFRRAAARGDAGAATAVDELEARLAAIPWC
jgi:TPR repeat protein